jgi:MFS-type transporter involved in bile tolerance (Atg22 family)
VGPAGFALLQQISGSYTPGLIAIAVLALAGSAVLAKTR